MLVTVTISLNIPQFQPENAWLFVLITLFTIITQLNQTDGIVPNSTYNASVFGYSMALISLGGASAVWVAILSHGALLFQKKEGKIPLYVLAFNIGGVVLPLYIADLTYRSLIQNENNGLLVITAILTAGLIFVGLNHLMFGLIHVLAEGTHIKESGMFGYILMIIDMTLFGLGAATALIWEGNPYAVILTIAPLYLFQMTLQVPRLEKQVDIEPKTGLYNFRYFNQELEKELTRANRYDRPLAVVMADLDYLRSVNNTFGHLAGDEILIGIAKLIKNSVREYDTVSRFGGEEFTILMPETSSEQAYPRIEALRNTIEMTQFSVSTHTSPIMITMSFGIAGRNHRNQTPSNILHLADLAVYEAKQSGRNRVVVSSQQTIP